MTVAILVGVMISIVVGVSLIPTFMSSLSTDNVADAAGKATGTGSIIVDVLPYVFVAIVLAGAVAYIGHSMGEREYTKKEESEEPKLRRGSFRGFLVGIGSIVTWPINRRGRIE